MSTKGMIYPQETPMLAGNPKDSAIAANNQATTRQANLIKATSGGNRRRYIHKRNKYGGATGGVAVPQYQMQYKPTGAGGQDPNSIIKQNSGLSTQGDANAQYDNLAAQKGGSRKKRGGNLNWGCYSGGRKKSRNRINRRKTHKKRRTNRRK
jgi:hypothetical protein